MTRAPSPLLGLYACVAASYRLDIAHSRLQSLSSDVDPGSESLGVAVKLLTFCDAPAERDAYSGRVRTVRSWKCP